MNKITALLLALTVASAAHAGWDHATNSDNFESDPWNSPGETLHPEGVDGWFDGAASGPTSGFVAIDISNGFMGSQGVSRLEDPNVGQHDIYRNLNTPHHQWRLYVESTDEYPHTRIRRYFHRIGDWRFHDGWGQSKRRQLYQCWILCNQ